jgi:hypothetical protein
MRIQLVGKIPNIKTIIGNIQVKRGQAFNQIARIGKQDIKTELRSPKSGEEKSARRVARYRKSPARRSAEGESLARDTGRSEKLIASDKVGSRLDIGFLEAQDGNNYVAKWEPVRPTIKHSMNRTLPKIQAIMNEVFKL